MSRRLPHLRPGDKQLSAEEFNNLSDSVRALQSIHGLAVHNATGLALRQRPQRKTVIPEQPITVLIDGYEAIGGFANAAFSCKRMDADGNATGDAFRVRARSSPRRMLEDLTKCVMPTTVGDWLEIKRQRVKLPNGNVNVIWMAAGWFHPADCEVRR